MKNRSKTGAQLLCPTAPLQSKFKNQNRLIDPSQLCRAEAQSEGGSSQIQPNPNHPLPNGKETGKETVKFLAIFDHFVTAIRLRFSPNPVQQSFENALFQSISKRFKDKKCPAQVVFRHFAVHIAQNFLAPPYDCAIVHRILGQMDSQRNG
jgi:hypothetical protein